MITKATDLEKLSEDKKTMIKTICSEDVSDDSLIKLSNELGISHLFPENKIADTFKIWLKVTGFIKAKGSEDNQMSILSWIDTEAKGYLNNNPNMTFKPEEIANALESRLAVISEMYLTTSELLDRVKEKILEETQISGADVMEEKIDTSD